jgi:hypothetical protein
MFNLVSNLFFATMILYYRTNIANGEAVANQYVHYPIILPKFPGRFYYYFGKPIETEGVAIYILDDQYLSMSHVSDSEASNSLSS